MTDFKQTLQACKHYGFNPEITAEQCWNEGYRLGRARWHWGPSWCVTFVGWVNTQKAKLINLISLPTSAKSEPSSGGSGDSLAAESTSPRT